MSLKEIHDDFIKTLGDESPSYSMLKWATEFTCSRRSVEDYEHSGCLNEATTDIELIHCQIMYDKPA